MKQAKTNVAIHGHRRLISLLLCLVMLLGVLSAFPAITISGEGKLSVTVMHDGSEVERLTVPEHERAELTAECTSSSDDMQYQWQILADRQAEMWVNIYDANSQRLSVSYALIQGLMDTSGSIYVRCRVTSVEEESISSPVCVTVEYTPILAYGNETGRTSASATASVSASKQSILRASAQTADDESDEQMVSITINYLDGVSGLPIYSAYTGHVNVSEVGYTANVISPTYLGYAPFYNAQTPDSTIPDASGKDHSALFPNSAATIHLNVTSETPLQYVINVYYFAINVPYAVRFYFQNIHDDLYTEDVGLYATATAKTGTIISNEKLAELAGTTATVGFTKLYHYPEAVAADGSTVFECYYDRNYRMLKFDTNGGYGVEPIYARYGTLFLVNNPTRHGYVFAGWDELGEDGTGDEKADTLPATVPDKNCTYRALWKTANTTYHVAYWLENADDEEYSYIGTRKMWAESASTVTVNNAEPLTDTLVICGNEEEEHVHSSGCYIAHTKFFVLDTEKNKGISAVVKGDGSTVLNVYYTRKFYTLRFIYAKEYNRNEDHNPNFDENNHLTGINYSVVGGSTYGFGNVYHSANTTWFKNQGYDYTVQQLLQHVNEYAGGDQWGLVEEVPTLKNSTYVTGVYPAEGQGYTGDDASGNYNQSGDRYYYFEITAQYGADLTELWPADVFEPVKVKNPSSHTSNGANNALDNGNGWGNYAYLAGWNGEFKVQYTLSNKNSTVKGLYQKLDDQLLLGTWASEGKTFSYNDSGDSVTRQIHTTETGGNRRSVESNVCYYLAFFDNGANINWSIPREWIYDLYVPVFEHEVPVDSELYQNIINASKIAPDRVTEKVSGKSYTWNQETTPRTYTYTDPDTGEQRVYYYYKGGIYRLYGRVTASDDNIISNANSVNGQTQTVLAGFEFLSDKDSERCEQIYNGKLADGRLSFTSRFFYTRDRFWITLHNHDGIYEADRREYDSYTDEFMLRNGTLKVPDYPYTLEENAYYFDGWYTSPECIDGTHYVENIGKKMPASDLVLYAKWAPKTHTVRFFKNHDDLVQYEKNQDEKLIYLEVGVKHGDVLGSVDSPSDGQYTFAGWFYEYAGKRYAYTPLDSPVVRDINVFAAWGDPSPQPYRIHYALDEPEKEDAWLSLLEVATISPEDNVTYTVKDGKEVRTYVYLASDGKFHLCIANDTNGVAYLGSTRTFTPKVGDPYNQLNSGYNTGYYPTLASHSVTMVYEENAENPKGNVFTFTYVHKEEVEYRVEYRYADTNQLIKTVADDGIAEKTTTHGVVTERFLPVTDYVPDAFYKRLIIAVEKNEEGEYVSASSNVVVFYYTKNNTSAYYAVHYMLQNLGAGTDYTQVNGKYVNYTESAAHTEGIGNLNQICEIPPQTFSGFTVLDTALVNGETETKLTQGSNGIDCFQITVSKDGTELYIFYTRNQQTYKVYYLEYGKVDISQLGSLQFDGSDNGLLRKPEVGTALFGDTVVVSAEKVSFAGMTCISPLTQSIPIRSNDEQNYIIFYYTPVQITIEYKVWAYGGGSLDNTIEVFDGDSGKHEYAGSTPTALEGYHFAGWYLDEACTVSVGVKGTVDPNTNHLEPVGTYLDAMPKTNVFYAKFVPDNGSLTIKRENGENDESNGTQVFVYKIQAENDPDYVIYVTITGNGSVTIHDLPCRKYTVEQQNGWSWRYEDGAKTVTVTEGGATVTFDRDASGNQWLNGNSERITNRKG